MVLTRNDFAGFFAELHGGYAPFDWQERLLDAVLDAGTWPAQVVAPTGAGKTAVIDVHVFAQALTADADPLTRPPRRLSLVVGRRALVDDQYDYAWELADRLTEPDSDLLGEIAHRLWPLRRPGTDAAVPAGAARGGAPVDNESGTPPVSPLVIGRLRGGELPSRAWRDFPTAVSVLCATPDMWGSRLLFRGYGSSWKAWPREAGLLAFDSVVVVDEAHLARQLLWTARRVERLAAVAESPLPTRPLQVVEATATPPHAVTRGSTVAEQHDAATHPHPGGDTSVGVEPEDLAGGGTLTERLTRPKPVRLVPGQDWAGTREPQRRRVAIALADAVQELMAVDHGRVDGAARTVGCFVNTVTRAIDVAAELRSRMPGGQHLAVVLLCGQVRPHDLDRLRATCPGILAPEGNDNVDVIVSTQSLEVGVDIDLAAMVTELASGSAIAQRAGRVNRRGLRPSGPVTVVVPAEEITEMTRSGPYSHAELGDALAWTRECASESTGMSPWRLRDVRPPAAQPRRALYQRPELADSWQWARTSDDLAAEAELDLWLSEDFETDTAVSVVVRESLPLHPDDALRLVRDLPPRRHELFGVPYRTALSALRRWGLTRDERSQHHPEEVPAPAVVVRGEDVALLTWRQARDGAPGELPVIRPGDVIVVDDREPLFTSSAAGRAGGFSPPVVAPGDGEGARLDRYRAPDVLASQPDDLPPDEWARRETGGVVLRLEPGLLADRAGAFADLAADLADTLVAVPDEDSTGDAADPVPIAERQRAVLGRWLFTSGLVGDRRMAAAASRLLNTRGQCELLIHTDPTPLDEGTDTGVLRITRVLLLDRRRASVDEGLRQVWTRSSRVVTLDRHQRAVADRAALIADHVGLPADLALALRLAGAHHDDGKIDDRFQRRLGRRGKVVLAKSPPGTTPEQTRRNETRSGLPGRWRHEQRSVIDGWEPVHAEAGEATDPLLVVRLIGTSHGHGRSGFPHTAQELLTTALGDRLHAIAGDAFDSGGWDELIERTQERYGVWGCAYLEALLRAADGQVSEEGS